MNLIRVALVDDQELVRTGFRMILDAEPDIEVVGEAADGEAALAVVAEHRPDVVLMDVRMPRMDGIEATRFICGFDDPPRILILTTFDIDDYVYEALRAGASGFLLKDTPADDLVAGVRVVASGEALLAPSVTRRLIEEFDIRPPDQKNPAGNLSGGNQQKVIVAREFDQDPKCLVAAQPTRGIDVGSIEFIHERLLQARDEGKAVLLISADLEEILSISDRIVVIYEGKIVGIMDPQEADEEILGLMMTGGHKP